MAQRIVVTGAAGQAGRAVVRDLREHGYDVLATDTVVSGDDRGEGMLKALIGTGADQRCDGTTWKASPA